MKKKLTHRILAAAMIFSLTPLMALPAAAKTVPNGKRAGTGSQSNPCAGCADCDQLFGKGSIGQR